MKPSHIALTFIMGLTSVTMLGACEFHQEKVNLTGGMFWQRAQAPEAIYMQGPKAQQLLHRDISRCVTELRELERLGTVKNAVPPYVSGRVMSPHEIELEDWDSPERNKELFAEHSDYTDFESCMYEKGWERVEHVPYDVADKGRVNYIKSNPDLKDGFEEYEQDVREKQYPAPHPYHGHY